MNTSLLPDASGLGLGDGEPASDAGGGVLTLGKTVVPTIGIAAVLFEEIGRASCRERV